MRTPTHKSDSQKLWMVALDIVHGVYARWTIIGFTTEKSYHLFFVVGREQKYHIFDKNWRGFWAFPYFFQVERTQAKSEITHRSLKL